MIITLESFLRSSLDGAIAAIFLFIPLLLVIVNLQAKQTKHRWNFSPVMEYPSVDFCSLSDRTAYGEVLSGGASLVTDKVTLRNDMLLLLPYVYIIRNFTQRMLSIFLRWPLKQAVSSTHYSNVGVGPLVQLSLSFNLGLWGLGTMLAHQTHSRSFYDFSHYGFLISRMLLILVAINQNTDSIVVPALAAAGTTALHEGFKHHFRFYDVLDVVTTMIIMCLVGRGFLFARKELRLIRNLPSGGLMNSLEIIHVTSLNCCCFLHMFFVILKIVEEAILQCRKEEIALLGIPFDNLCFAMTTIFLCRLVERKKKKD